MGHRRGESRQQTALFPVMLDELVADDALVRVVDAWVDSLDLKALGFQKAQAQVLGAPPYDPADLLKLYIWGYLSALRSSRGLERECGRNVECMWLLGRLAPDHKTIAEFRRTNTQALVAVCAAFVQFARAQRLIAGSTVAVDGSKVRAVASRKAVVGRRQLVAQAERNAREIEQYMKLLEDNDQREAGQQRAGGDVRRTLDQLQGQQQAIQADLQRMQGGNTLVRSEPQAQAMRSLGSAPGYNLQTAVETQSHLIVAQAVINEANDQRQLAPMAQAASQALGQPCTVIADGGYGNGEQLAKLEDDAMTSYVAVKRSANSHGGGTLYDRSAFSYDRESDSFTCPAHKILVRKKVNRRDKQIVYTAHPQDCAACPNKPQCTQSKARQVTRHLYEDALQANASRVAEQPQMMALRRQTAEHPFGTIKNGILGNARLLMRGLQGAQAELSIAVLVYNLKRVFNMKGAHWMRAALQA
jgi:transposase